MSRLNEVNTTDIPAAIRLGCHANTGDLGQRPFTDRVRLALGLASQEIVSLDLWHGEHGVSRHVGPVVHDRDHPGFKHVVVLVHVG